MDSLPPRDGMGRYLPLHQASFTETKTRSIIKSVFWRLIAILNSFLILKYTSTTDALSNALIMNVTGFILFFLFERTCDKLSFGRKIITNEDEDKINPVSI